MFTNAELNKPSLAIPFCSTKGNVPGVLSQQDAFTHTIGLEVLTVDHGYPSLHLTTTVILYLSRKHASSASTLLPIQMVGPKLLALPMHTASPTIVPSTGLSLSGAGALTKPPLLEAAAEDARGLLLGFLSPSSYSRRFPPRSLPPTSCSSDSACAYLQASPRLHLPSW